MECAPESGFSWVFLLLPHPSFFSVYGFAASTRLLELDLDIVSNPRTITKRKAELAHPLVCILNDYLIAGVSILPLIAPLRKHRSSLPVNISLL